MQDNGARATLPFGDAELLQLPPTLSGDQFPVPSTEGIATRALEIWCVAFRVGDPVEHFISDDLSTYGGDFGFGGDSYVFG